MSPAPAHATEMPLHLAENLRRAYRDHDPHRRAAVELLIWHETWLRRRTFFDAAMSIGDDDTAWINFGAAREAFDRGEFNRSSTSELAILDLAIALGQDRYRFNIMGTAHSAAIARAVAAAVGLDLLTGPAQG